MKLILNKPAFKNLKPVKLNIGGKKLSIFGLKNLTSIDNKKNRQKFFFYEDNKKKYFVKRVSSSEINSLTFLKNLNSYLISNKFNVPKIKKIIVLKSFKKKQFLIMFDYIFGNYIKNNSKDLKNLSKATYYLHKKMLSYRAKDKVKKNTLRRLQLLEEIRKKYITHKNHKNPYKYKLIKEILIAGGDIYKFYISLLKNSQCIHGDLVPGNILYGDKKIHFLDFEDSYYSFFPIEFDLALIIERHILIKKISTQNKNTNIQIFLNTYLKNRKIKKLNYSLIQTLNFLTSRALITLISPIFEKKKIDKNEINKFLKIYSINKKMKDKIKILNGKKN